MHNASFSHKIHGFENLKEKQRDLMCSNQLIPQHPVQITAIHGRDDVDEESVSDTVLVVVSNSDDVGMVDVSEDLELLAIFAGRHCYLLYAEFGVFAADGCVYLCRLSAMNDLA